MMRLQPDQEKLLAALCDAARRAHDDTFTAHRTFGGQFLQHSGIDDDTFPEWAWNDLGILVRSGLLHATDRKRNALAFVVSPRGFEYMDARQGPKLRPSQVELLDQLCRAAEASTGDFMLIRAMQGTFVMHPGLPAPITIAASDFDELADADLLRHQSLGGKNRPFAITTKGWEHWEGLRADKDAVAKIEVSVRRLLESAPTDSPYAEAFKKWAAAEAMLWTAREEPAHLTALGVVCRDAVQRFADLFAREQGYVSEEPASRTINRVVGGITALRGRLSDRHVDLLDALETYWRAVDGLVQRQVHAAEKGGEPIDWDDARVVVTQTALIMFELIRASERAKP